MQSLCHSYEILQVVVSYVNLSKIHVLENGFQNIIRDIMKEEDGVSWFVFLQQILKWKNFDLLRGLKTPEVKVQFLYLIDSIDLHFNVDRLTLK